MMIVKRNQQIISRFLYVWLHKKQRHWRKSNGTASGTNKTWINKKNFFEIVAQKIMKLFETFETFVTKTQNVCFLKIKIYDFFY